MRRRGENGGRIISWILIGLLLAIILLEGILVLYKRSDLRFLFAETVGGWFRSSGIEKVEEIETREWSLTELLGTGNVLEDDSLLLINDEHRISSDFSESVGEYKTSGVQMNTCVMPAYAALAAEIRRECNDRLYISSSYRTAKKQKEIVETSAKNVAAGVGASEHQAGLALDIYFNGYAGRAVLKCEAGRYLYENCYRHGFIIRYPFGKSSVTDTAFEPWHLRYVGAPHAEIMYLDGIVLEEYMELLNAADYYRYGDYLITRQESEPFLLPEKFESGVVSGDNQGGYIITLKIQ